MMYGIVDGEKRTATPGMKGQCPGCAADVVARCGMKNEWHWAHIAKDCPYGSAGETEWHMNWKKRFPKEMVEVVVGDVRADVLLPDGTAIEFQNSPIDIHDITLRASTYKRIIWVVNGREFIDRFRVATRKEYDTYRWKHRRKWVEDLVSMKGKGHVLIDFNGWQFFEIMKSHGKRGWGYLYDDGPSRLINMVPQSY